MDVKTTNTKNTSFHMKRTFRNKIVLPIAATFLFSFLAAYVAISKLSFDEILRTAEKSLLNQVSKITSEISKLSERALLLTLPISQITEIERAYLIPDETRGRNALRAALIPHFQVLQKHSNLSHLRLHFHKPPARSFLRTWIAPGNPAEGGG